MTFHETLISNAIDKGVLALILLIAALYLNRILESHKVREARQSEFLKLRILAMNDCWSAIYAWMNSCDNKVRVLSSPPSDSDLAAFRKHAVAETNDLIDSLASKRFLSGEKFTLDCTGFCGARLDWYMSHDPRKRSSRDAPPPPWDDVVAVQEKYLK